MYQSDQWASFNRGFYKMALMIVGLLTLLAGTVQLALGAYVFDKVWAVLFSYPHRLDNETIRLTRRVVSRSVEQYCKSLTPIERRFTFVVGVLVLGLGQATRQRVLHGYIDNIFASAFSRLL